MMGKSRTAYTRPRSPGSTASRARVLHDEGQMGFNRRTVLCLPAAAIATGWRSAQAQAYPARPAELIVPFAAGGGTDLLARLVSEGLAKRLGQPFVVVNRPGANTNLGTS